MSDGYGIEVHMGDLGSQRYRMDGHDRWDLTDAEALAHHLLTSRDKVTYVSFGDGDNEFRAWSRNVSDFGAFGHPDVRWAEWYVDVEINDHRWRYRPCADLADWEAADRMASQAAELTPVVTRIWLGASDGSEEFDFNPADEH